MVITASTIPTIYVRTIMLVAISRLPAMRSITIAAPTSGNAAITAELEAEGYAVEDVISLKTKADGAVIVYVDDRA